MRAQLLALFTLLLAFDAEGRRLLSPLVDKLIIQSRQLGFTLDEVFEQLSKRDLQLSRPTNSVKSSHE